jgi:hypothetical protein
LRFEFDLRAFNCVTTFGKSSLHSLKLVERVD